MQKHLYVLKFRKSQCQPVHELTAFEQLAGWRDKNYRGDEIYLYHRDQPKEAVVVNDGHERGSLHTRIAPHILAWEVEPGDEVLAVLSVDHDDDGLTCQPWCVSPDQDYFLIECLSVLGRAVMLGEDDADAAFGNDSLLDCLQAAVEGDFRKTLCECRATLIDGELPAEILAKRIELA